MNDTPVTGVTRVGCIGEVIIELIAGAQGSAALGIAGDTYNTAVYLVRALAGTGTAVDYVTVLGQDRFSDRILAHMAEHGVGTGAAARHPTRIPGLYAIDTDEGGERSFTYWRSEAAARTLFGDDGREAGEVVANYGLVVLSGISIAILPQSTRTALHAALDAYRARGGLVAFDSNYRPRLWGDVGLARRETMAMWARTDIALPSLDDEMALFGDTGEAAVVARLRGAGVGNGALKRGDGGPIDLGPGGAAPAVAKAARVVDTTAAGDSFNAGYLAALLKGGDPVAAMLAGHDLAIRVIGRRGAIVDLD